MFLSSKIILILILYTYTIIYNIFYCSWMKMENKKDFMRCALKKRETLPYLVKDHVALEHLNTFLSLLFKHSKIL
jgi:hypothetical protein